MFIRRTQTRSTPSGQTYFTHRLVRSHRLSGKVRQQTLLNLGRHFAIPRHDWPLLCRRLDEILSGQLPLIQEGSTPLEEEAQRMAERLLEGEADVTGTAGEASSEDLQTVAVDSVELTRPRSVGVEQVGRWALEQLGLVELLGELGLNGPMRAAAVGAIVGRLARPGSERATWGWLGRRSGLGELLDFDFQTLSLMQMYRASDALMRHRQAIEAHLFTRAMGLFDLQPTVTLFDLTNTFFEGAARRQPKAQRGHSKEKRSDCPLLTLGLVLDGAGFVRRSQVFAGRVDEPRTLAGMLGALEAPRGALVVMDRGVATEDRIQWLREEGYRYVVASRQGHRQFDPELALTLETASKARLQLHKEVSEDGGGSASLLPFRGAGSQGTGYCRAFQPALRAGARPTLRGALTAAGSQGHREGPGTDRAVEGAESRRGSTLHHRGPHQRERPQGDGPDLEASAPPGLDGHSSGGLLPAQQPDRLG